MTGKQKEGFTGTAGLWQSFKFSIFYCNVLGTVVKCSC